MTNASPQQLCAQCNGPLKDADGTYYQKLLEGRRTARVIFVCFTCKHGAAK